MKRSLIFTALLLIALQLAAIAVPLSAAAGGDVLKGTPIMDGVLDDIYKQSYSYTITVANEVHKSGAEYSDAKDTSATSYFLWDDYYIYVCTVVTDSTLLSVGEAAVKEADYTWQNDVCEMWWQVDGESDPKLVNLDAFGYKMGGSPTVTGSEGYLGKSTNNGKDSYIIEFAYPKANKSGDKFNYSTQINNILAADASKIVCIGDQRAPHTFTLSSKEVVLPIVEKPATKPTTTAAQTADFSLLAAAVAMGASVIVALKSRKR